MEAERVRLGGAKRAHFADCAGGIDQDGHVRIRLAGGGAIRDAGNAIQFSPEADTRQAARLYAQAKFGKHVRETDGIIKKDKRRTKPSKPPVAYLRKCALRGVPDAAALSTYGTRLSERSPAAMTATQNGRNEPPRPAKERGEGWER